MVGNLALTADVLMRTRCVVRKGSLQTYSASAAPLAASMLGMISSAFMTSSLNASRPSWAAAAWTRLHFQPDERAIGIAKDSHSIESRYDFTQQFKSEAPKIGLTCSIDR